jgi:uncharacterized protein
MSDATRQHTLDVARATLASALPDNWVIYAYGSFARGDERPDSDLDLGVLMPPGIDFPDRLTLMADVAQKVGREVDIVNLRAANLDLIHEILREGRALLVRCPAEVLAWEAEQMTDHSLFAPRRLDIVNTYLHAPLGKAR